MFLEASKAGALATRFFHLVEKEENRNPRFLKGIKDHLEGRVGNGCSDYMAGRSYAHRHVAAVRETELRHQIFN